MATKDKAPYYLAAFVAVVFIVAICVFLFTKSSYLEYEISGLEVVKSYTVGDWVLVILGLAGTVIFGYGSYANLTGSDWLGRKMRGNIGTTILLAALALACLCGPWGKACTDKANGGVGIKKEIRP